MKHLTLPLTPEAIASLRAGDEVLLTGWLYTGRDAAHKRMMELLDAGKPLPPACPPENRRPSRWRARRSTM